jgi:hypothetical protein
MQTVIAEYLTPEIEQLIAIASDLLNVHGNDQGLCPYCQEPWPCERASLAAFTLETL